MQDKINREHFMENFYGVQYSTLTNKWSSFVFSETLRRRSVGGVGCNIAIQKGGMHRAIRGACWDMSQSV